MFASSSSAEPRPDAGRRFVDCAECPAMVAVPDGTVLIGSPPGEVGRYGNEGPQRTIGITRLAVGAFEVTRRQYAAFATATRRAPPGDCLTHGDGTTFDTADNARSGSWRDPGFRQSDDHPVVCVSWQDADAYVAWLSRRTGKPYRLLSEAEWEYAARGGTRTAFFWGATADRACRYANGSDPSLVRALPAWIETVRRAAQGGDTRAGILPCDDGSAFTAAVGRYAPNRYGLHDMSGNVWEHVADCWVAGGYDAIGDDGAAVRALDCQRRRVRGGSWDDYAIDLRSARRTGGLSATQRRNDTGFRVALTLRP